MGRRCREPMRSSATRRLKRCDRSRHCTNCQSRRVDRAQRRACRRRQALRSRRKRGGRQRSCAHTGSRCVRQEQAHEAGSSKAARAARTSSWACADRNLSKVGLLPGRRKG
eukprot:2715608-Prymnesium_polylepis.1